MYMKRLTESKMESSGHLDSPAFVEPAVPSGDGGSESRILQGASSCQRGQEAEPVLSRHALHSTWEEIYQEELDAAVSRQRYRRRQKREEEAKRNADNSPASSRTGSHSSTSSDDSSLDGEEWFGPECAKIASWVVDTLRKPHDHPLQMYFRALHASRSSGATAVSQCQGGSCNWCRGEGPLITKEFTALPVLDLGCGGGQFLARLRRFGFLHLAGVDYSASAIRLAKANLWRSKTRTVGGRTCHICLRQANLSCLTPFPGFSGSPIMGASAACICCCSKNSNTTEDSRESRLARAFSSCMCGPATSLPPYPVVFDKGTFDVFWLMRTPEVYVQSMCRLMPQHGLLFLTSCNCTVEELDNLFCPKPAMQLPRLLPTGFGTGGPKTMQQVHSYPGEAIGAKGLQAQPGMSSVSSSLCTSSSLAAMPGFERIGLLPHRSLKYGGVEGQVVTSVLLRRL